MDLAIVSESIVALFIMILVGVYARRRNIITDEMNKGLVNILIQIALPFMIITSFLHTYDSTIKANVVSTIYYSIIAYILMAAISYSLLKPVKKDKKTILHFANVFVNTGYVGFPILNSIYGAEGVVYGSIFNMFFVLLLWTYGIALFTGRWNAQEFKKVLLNPSILAVCAGIIIMFFNIRIPSVIEFASKGIGNLTGPLSMMIIGGILSNIQINRYLRDWTIYYGIAVKLIIIPIAIYLVALFTKVSSIAINSVIIMTAMPASTMTSILSETFDKEKEYAAIVVSVTTLLSLFTVIIFIGFVLG
ncbi:MAG: AEC family transporter [Firmicutes bacterium]|nr:AEC family transporter [Bacillota bacterium]